MTVSELDRETLSKLYLEDLLTEVEIASLYGTSQAKISRLRKKWGISTLGKTGRSTRRLPVFTPEQESLLLGCLLGSATMESPSSATARLIVRGPSRYGAYLQWKADILGPHVSSMSEGVEMLTKTSTHLLPWYNLFYSSKGATAKAISGPVDHILTPLALAVWYLDSGYTDRAGPVLPVNMCKRSLKFLLTALRTLGLRPVTGEGCVRFPFQSEKFYGMVRPHVPDCMLNRLSIESTEDSQFSFTLPEADEILLGYDSKSYSRTDSTQDGWVGEIHDILSKTPFPFDEFPDENVLGDLRKLRDLDPHLDDEGFIRPQSWRGTPLCKRFFPNRYRAVSTTSGVSAYEAWHLGPYLKRAIEMQLRYGDPVTPSRVLRAITAQVRTPTVFRPVVARYLYETYAKPGDTVWDPCAGYGGRLLGAAAAGVRYIGTDVDPETVTGNRELAAALGYEEFEVVQCPAEEFECPPVDFVFTSPPYFDRERYLGSDQSWKSYSTLEAWVSGFLTPVLRTAWDALPKGAHLAINIADLKERGRTVPLVEETIQSAVKIGFTHSETLKMPIAKLRRKAGYEPILVFSR